MQVVSIGDNLYEMSKPVFWENKKKISICHSAENLPRVLKARKRISSYNKVFKYKCRDLSKSARPAEPRYALPLQKSIDPDNLASSDAI